MQTIKTVNITFYPWVLYMVENMQILVTASTENNNVCLSIENNNYYLRPIEKM